MHLSQGSSANWTTGFAILLAIYHGYMFTVTAVTVTAGARYAIQTVTAEACSNIPETTAYCCYTSFVDAVNWTSATRDSVEFVC